MNSITGVEQFVVWAHEVMDNLLKQRGNMDIHGIQKGLYTVKAHEVEAPFVAYWNGHRWTHAAMRYNINIHTWIKL